MDTNLERKLGDLHTVCSLVAHSRATVMRWIKDGTFPPGFLTGPRSRRWDLTEIQTWIDLRKSGSQSDPKLELQSERMRAVGARRARTRRLPHA